ncbi:YeeE/YedE family integral membrane protein [Umbelopsis sp. PMI_123]|nr:YeeE/YedE family integral membrane protein [Umbelopsis sp. PMI_123]
MFTPVQSLLGGCLLFSSVTALAAYNGKVAGISGIVNGVVWGESNSWRRSFILGMATSALALRFCTSDVTAQGIPAFPYSTTRALAAGLLVGAGTKLGSGCTSGHMLCGLARFSKRSVVASATFFATGVITVYLTGGVPYRYGTSYPSSNELAQILGCVGAAATIFKLLPTVLKKNINNTTNQVIVSFLSGLTFALGLYLAGMTNTDKVRGFLDLTQPQRWDPSLMMVVIGGLVPNTIAYQFFLKNQEKPEFSSTYDWPTKKNVDSKLVIGAALFGIGWGLCGVCPGPGLVTLFARPSLNIAAFWASCLLGSRAVQNI